MRKTYAMKDFFGVAILLLFALIIVFFSLIGFVTVKPKKVTFSKPFFHHVNEIAVNGDDIYGSNGSTYRQDGDMIYNMQDGSTCYNNNGYIQEF